MKLIKKLRELGGKWTAHRSGFEKYWYEGKLNNSTYEIRSYAHLDPLFDGDDDTFVVRWHITKDGKSFKYPSTDPLFYLHYKINNKQASL